MLTLENYPDTGSSPKTVRLGVLISGRGSNCMALVRAVAEGRLTGCEVGVVISNIPGALGIEAAKSYGIPVITLEGRGRDQRDHEDAVSALLRKFRIDLVCLAGYRRVLSSEFLDEWPHRVLSIHASLLPAFSGRNPTQQALDFGAQITGCTVHFVEHGGYGPIIVQQAIPIHDGDDEHDVFERIFPEQQASYIEAVRRIASGEYEVRGKRYVRLEPSVEEIADEIPAFAPES